MIFQAAQIVDECFEAMQETEMEYWEAAHEIMLKETLGDGYAAYIAQFESEDYMVFCEAEEMV